MQSFGLIQWVSPYIPALEGWIVLNFITVQCLMMVTIVNVLKDDLTMFLTLKETQRERREAVKCQCEHEVCSREILREIRSVHGLEASLRRHAVQTGM